MGKPGLRIVLVIAGAGLLGVLLTSSVDARGRMGSRRVYSGPGKGSHYVGGKK